MSTTDDPLDPQLEERLRRGLALLAEQTPPARARRAWLPAAAAAVLLVVAGVGAAVVLRDDSPQPVPPVIAAPTSTVIPPIGLGVSYDLARLVRESPRIVVGTVTKVTHGSASEASGGLDYVLADIDVERTLSGPAEQELVAFGYDYGGAVTAGSAAGASFVEGERVLLFLSSAAGTVQEGLGTPHWQVTGGASGKYTMRDGQPEASFTLEQVEQQLR